MLIQKRQATRERYPGCWDISAGGLAKSGEDTLTAVLWETQEEIGVVPEKVQFLFTEPFRSALDDFFLGRCDLPASAFCVQEEEVSEVKWASRGEVLTLLDGGQFVDYDWDILLHCFSEARKFL